jgi:hypothetical protein
MDIPLSGALFITNPRRRNKRRVPTRDNGAKDRFIARTLGKTLKSVQGLKKRNYAAYKKLFTEAGGDSAFRKYKAKGVRTRKAVKSGTYSHSTWGGKSSSKSKSTRKNPMKNNPAKGGQIVYNKFRKILANKGWARFEISAAWKTLKKKSGPAPKYRGILSAARNLKSKSVGAATKGQRKTAKMAVKSKRGKDGKMRYWGYLNGHYGLITREDAMSRRKLGKKLRKPATKKKKATKKKAQPASRRKAVSRKTARVGRPLLTARSGGLSKRQTSRGMRYMQGGRFISKDAYNRAVPRGLRVANPKRRRKAVRRRNPKSSFGALALRKNPGLLGLLEKGGSAVSDVPVVGGFLGPKVAPIGLGLVVGGVHFYAMRYLGPKLPELGAMVGGYLGREEQGYDLGMKAQKVGYTIGGVAVATALQAGRKFAPEMFPAATVNVLSTGALIVGAAVDFIDYMRGGDSSEASMDEEFSGLAYEGGQLNGLAYEGGQLNGLAYEGGQLNGAHLNGMHSLNEAYMRAPFEDAAYSGPDFHAAEGQAFMHGPAAYMSKFGLPAMRAGRRSGMSPMAGKAGHRWAWLVRLIGFDRAAQLASMPADKRVRVIAKMRHEAKLLVDRTSAYSGLAYEGGQLNGLAYTGGRV